MASQNQQESYNENVRCSNNTTTLNLKNCSNMNQSYDLNSSCIKLDENYLPSQRTNENEHFFKKCHKGEGRKRSFMEMEMGEEEKRSILDLNLRLTPLGLHQNDHLSSNQYSELSSTSTSSCKPFNLDSSSEEVEFSDTKFEEPSLILMGCSRCLIYVMVSEINPKCPNCNTSILIDIFRNSFGKKSRIC
ncbi:hypothetical protein REPUB_Repub03eG0251200 [Reevesia pubescens]